MVLIKCIPLSILIAAPDLYEVKNTSHTSTEGTVVSKYNTYTDVNYIACRIVGTYLNFINLITCHFIPVSVKWRANTWEEQTFTNIDNNLLYIFIVLTILLGTYVESK